MQVQCPHCNTMVESSAGQHFCRAKGTTIPISQLITSQIEKKDDGDFATSMVVGMATDSAVIGALVGGDIIGGLVGESIADFVSDSND